MNTAQRVVLVVALGLGIAVVVATINTILWDPWSDGGWFNYAPESGLVMSSERAHGSDLGAAVVWLVGIGLWAGVAAFLFRNGRKPVPDGPRGTEAAG
jgi:hypothetical protein